MCLIAVTCKLRPTWKLFLANGHVKILSHPVNPINVMLKIKAAKEEWCNKVFGL